MRKVIYWAVLCLSLVPVGLLALAWLILLTLSSGFEHGLRQLLSVGDKFEIWALEKATEEWL
jgi:hypothetical protein